MGPLLIYTKRKDIPFFSLILTLLNFTLDPINLCYIPVMAFLYKLFGRPSSTDLIPASSLLITSLSHSPTKPLEDGLFFIWNTFEIYIKNILKSAPFPHRLYKGIL